MDVTTVGPNEIRSLISVSDAIPAVRDAFIELHRGEFEMPTRTALRDGSFLVMSAHHRPSASAIVKTLSLNFTDRVPAIVGTVVWSELGHTHHLVADASEITRIRTGAIVGVATDLLAPANASSCTIIGAGGQSADQVRAVHAVRPLTALRIVDRSGERAHALAESIQGELPIAEVVVEEDIGKAVRDVDIICCSTTATSPLFSADAVSRDVHVNAIGAFRPTMREVPDELFADATVVIDEKVAVLEEAGDVIHAVKSGTLTEDRLIELGAALNDGVGSVVPQTRKGRTVFKTVGVAIQDWVIARLLAERCW
jgi:ornithine cyclodeaminase/alanine dehydrogenase-like protein (mu-crystallin family)